LSSHLQADGKHGRGVKSISQFCLIVDISTTHPGAFEKMFVPTAGRNLFNIKQHIIWASPKTVALPT